LRPATTLGVNAAETSRRSRVWSGGSRNRNDEGRAESTGGASDEFVRSLLARGSRNNRVQSACRPTITSLPFIIDTGEISRSRCNNGYGSARVAGSSSAPKSSTDGSPASSVMRSG
jgi:hypothetical protein